MFKLCCKVCGERHNATIKNFPVAFFEHREVFEGKGRRRRSLGVKPVVAGYGCSKCVKKHRRTKFIEQHEIRPGPGERMVDAIKKKIGELKLKPKHAVAVPQRQKPKGWERVKNWTKNRFFKKRGRE